MRIRGNARIADIMDLDGIAPAYPPEMLQTHVCELNQSPWDVVTFPADSTFTFPPENRLDGDVDDSLTANGSIGDSIGAVESHSVVPMVEDGDATDRNDCNQLNTTRVVEGEGKGKPAVAAKTKPDEIASAKNKTILFCNKSDGKGWQCRKAAKEGHALCEHHLAQLRSYNSSNQSSSRKLDKPAATAAADRPPGRRRGRGLKKPTSNPNEYYYYSGFGPLWGKKRGCSKPESNRNDLKTEFPPSYSSQIDSPDDVDQKIEEDYDNDDDDDDDVDDIVDEDENGDGVKKRIRKPVKARSLKSLM